VIDMGREYMGEYTQKKNRQSYPKFTKYVRIMQEKHGSKFSMADLDMRFVPFFENEYVRIKVDIYGNVLTGMVSITADLKPKFLLVRRSNSLSSSDLLTKETKLLATKWPCDYGYVPVYGSGKAVVKKSWFK